MNIQEGLLVVYFLVAINFLFNKLKDFSCHVQRITTENLYVKHGLNIIAVFFLLVIFTRGNPMPPNFIVAATFVMYGFFILITRCEYRFLAVFLTCMVIVFYIEATKAYKLSQNPPNKEELKKKYEKTQVEIQIFSFVVVVVGVLVYIGQHVKEYKDTWDWHTFWVGVNKCAGNGSMQNANILNDLTLGIRKMT